MSDAHAWRIVAGGVEVGIRVTPRAGRTDLVGVIVDGQGRPVVHVRLAAPPVEGAANDALVAFLADRLALRKRDIAIRSGHNARLKRIALTGDPAELGRRLSEGLAATDQ